ncbi:MAG: DUF2752 domain-containing protein [Candidatus Omnitrophota bacterium]
MKNFLIECISLSTPRARLAIFSIAILFLCLVDLPRLRIPDLCIWKRMFGFCPAEGSLRSLNAFFRGNFSESIRYNLNIVVILPVLLSVIVKDALGVFRHRK